MFIVKGNDEPDVKDNLFKAKTWYIDNSEWEEEPLLTLKF